MIPPPPTPSVAAVEARAQAVFAEAGLAPERWSNGPGAVYAPHTHPYDTLLIVVSGSIQFLLEATGERSERRELAAGDRLDVPAGTFHSAVVGPRGVVCLEGHGQGDRQQGRSEPSGLL